jgi:hypothetical protein
VSADYLEPYFADDLATFLEGGDSIIGRSADLVGGYGTALRLQREMNGVRDAMRAKRLLEPKGAA